MTVATGLAIGLEPSPALVREAVTQAMEKANLTIANSVLLFLSSHFAREPAPALLAAARAASCTQIVGCSAPGIFTEQEWVLDSPSAAAMVFGGDLVLRSESAAKAGQQMMALTAPNAINIQWLSEPGERFGGVSGDATGQGPFSVWHHGKGAASGYCEASITGVDGTIGTAHGVRVLTKLKPVTAVQGYDLVYLGGKPALDTLIYAYSDNEPLPLHRLMLGISDSVEAAKHGDYRLISLVCANEADRTVTLSRLLENGQLAFWALREAGAAERDMEHTLDGMQKKLKSAPDFGLLFSCLGRGPYFYSGVDRDLEIIREKFPGMPLIGFYGNGEIAPINGVNELLQYSAVLGLFHEAVSA